VDEETPANATDGGERDVPDDGEPARQGRVTVTVLGAPGIVDADRLKPSFYSRVHAVVGDREQVCIFGRWPRSDNRFSRSGRFSASIDRSACSGAEPSARCYYLEQP